MAARVAFPITNFQTADGNAVANGYLRIRLSTDGVASGVQVEHKFTKITLDSSGNVTGSPTVYHNTDLLPAGSYYIYLVYTAKGQLIAGPIKITV